MYYRENDKPVKSIEPYTYPQQTHRNPPHSHQQTSQVFPTWLLLLIIGILIMGCAYYYKKLDNKQAQSQLKKQGFGFRFY
jgi:hypothetical protein